MLVASVSPDVLSLAERMYIYPGTWYAATNMFSTIFSIFSQKDHQKQLSFQLAELTVQGYINSSIICYKLVYRDCHHLTMCSKVDSWLLLFYMNILGKVMLCKLIMSEWVYLSKTGSVLWASLVSFSQF